jgi:hypothetical protein
MPASILPLVLLTFPSRDGRCEEVECDAIGVEFSPFVEGAHSASWASFDALYGSWFSLDNPLPEFLFDDMFIVFGGDVAQTLVVEALIQAPPWTPFCDVGYDCVANIYFGMSSLISFSMGAIDYTDALGIFNVGTPAPEYGMPEGPEAYVINKSASVPLSSTLALSDLGLAGPSRQMEYRSCACSA